MRFCVLFFLFLVLLSSCTHNKFKAGNDPDLLYEASKLIALESNPQVAWGLPRSASPTEEILISRKQYVISWNKKNRSMNWASWHVNSKNLGRVRRSMAFDPDPILGALAVTPSDYTGSCYDRGHIVPSAERTNNPVDNIATFLMSNITPQTAQLNRVTWEHMERYERDLVHSGKELAIIAGPIYERDLGAIGPHKDIKVPSHFFRITIIFNKDEPLYLFNRQHPLIALIVPNQTSQKTWPNEDAELRCEDSKEIEISDENTDDWKAYQVSLEQIEKATGLHFFN